ncbi:MAG TPA: amidohydrolase family protein [Beijerinckiaceae bacterium]|nr:amidohydrolase family protein [Beijerinckiaceae bacterium]
MLAWVAALAAAVELREKRAESEGEIAMRIVDSHFHWWPRSLFEQLCKRKTYPRAEKNGKGGYAYWREEGQPPRFDLGREWLDLESQFEHMDKLGYEVDVVCSIGPLSVHFSDLPPEEGRDAALLWNEEMAGAQRKYPGRLWASGAVPLVDTKIAIEVMDHAINNLGLMGINLPGSVGSDARIDAQRLEPFYDRAEQLGIPLFLHPTDAVFADMLDGYDGALHLSLGRVIEVSVAASRLILSGMMERHPDLKIVMSHTGGALPYQSGRMDKNGKAAKLRNPPSAYIKRLYTDTVSPHMLGIKFAVEYFGVDHVMYGSDYPCWSPAEALRLVAELGLSSADQEKILNSNARRILGLREPAQSGQRGAREAALA